MKCYVGDIITVDAEDSVYKYLVEAQGKILYVGNDLPEKYQSAERIDLGTGALIPSFVDSHQHFVAFSTFYAGLNVMDAESNSEIAEMIRDFVSRSKKHTLIAFGASPYSVKERRLINRAELDTVCPDKEMMVVKYDGHACIINSKLMKKLNDKIKGLRGYHSDTGEMNQEAFFEVSNYITSAISPISLIYNMQSAVDFMASMGIGCVHTVSGVGYVGDIDISTEKLLAKSLTNGFQLRVFPQSMDIHVAQKRKLPRIGGCFKCALDGCFGSHDASLNKDYADAMGGQGVLYYDDQTVIEFCKSANRAGLQIEMHAIGDRAFDQACRALKAALDDYPRDDHRHAIIHACLPTESGIEICSRYHILLPMQSAFIDWRQEPNEYLERILGTERLKRLNPIRSFQDKGILISFGSDAPCTTPDPLDWIHRAVNNENREEAISVRDALRMCTYNGYYTSFDEKERGSLEVGKIADMVILSENIYNANPAKLKEIKVETLLLGGKVYQSAKQGILPTLVNGFFSNRKF